MMHWGYDVGFGVDGTGTADCSLFNPSAEGALYYTKECDAAGYNQLSWNPFGNYHGTMGH